MLVWLTWLTWLTQPPFLQNVVVTHKVVYHNDEFNGTEGRYTNDNSEMHRMWRWFNPCFKYLKNIEDSYGADWVNNDSITVKRFFTI